MLVVAKRNQRCHLARRNMRQDTTGGYLDLDHIAESINLLFLRLPLQLLCLAGSLNLTLELQLAFSHYPLSWAKGICELCTPTCILLNDCYAVAIAASATKARNVKGTLLTASTITLHEATDEVEM